ncbi:MAG: hypothetical protein LPK07_15035 [Hymenobacteraceae bacterium]|nr:hypothetical protein [Hymenobacteraceae bacterium]MDX5482991.1 hypothetical protein [Hymenobacteraceae bacterium]
MKKLPIYGESPLHLAGVVFCYGLAAYAGLKLFDNVPLWIALAFPAGIFLHDFVLFPLYSGADRVLKRIQRKQLQEGKITTPWINYVRVPVIISFLLLFCYFPIILRLADERELYTALSQDTYLYRWLIVSAVFAAGAVLSYFLRARKTRQP